MLVNLSQYLFGHNEDAVEYYYTKLHIYYIWGKECDLCT